MLALRERYLVILPLIAFLFSGGRASAIDCRKLYFGIYSPHAIFEPHLGEAHDVTSEGTRYLLGGGGAGGTVFRVIPFDPKAPTYLEKEYKFPDEMADEWAILRTLKGSATGKETGFHIPNVNITTRGTMKIDDVAGRDLHSLMMDPTVDSKLKEKLRATYEEKLTQFKRHIERTTGVRMKDENWKDYFFGDRKNDGLRLMGGTLPVTGGRKKNDDVLIKSDNIIVHYDAVSGKIEMTLIDPR